MKVLFVCAGNTCRSPMLKFAFDKYVENMSICGVESDSAGLTDCVQPMSAYAAKALDLRQIPHTTHLSKQLDENLFRSADVIICAERSHKTKIIDLYGKSRKIKSVYDICGNDVEDPYGKSFEEYVKTLDVIQGTIPVIWTYLLKHAF